MFLPVDKEYSKAYICPIVINGKSYNCIKFEYIHKSYGHNADCDIMEYMRKNFKYCLCNASAEDFKLNDNSKSTFIINDNGDGIECYMSGDLKTFIPLNPIISERIYAYRKFKVLRRLLSKRKPIKS